MARTSRTEPNKVPGNTEDRVINAVDNHKSSNGKDTFTLSSGVVLKAKRISGFLITDVMRQFERPRIPRVYIESIGREEDNPDDPDYLSRVETWERESSLAVLDTMFVAGTELVSVPDGMEGPDGNDWVEMLDASGIQMSDNKKRRYLLWLKHVATNEDDITLISDEVGRKSGVVERDVETAAKQFRRRT